MSTLQNIRNWVFYGSIGATILILSLLITLFLYDRRQEMGIYLALGEKKNKIIFQILLEIMVIAFIGITLAVFTGHLISSHLSQNMLENELLVQLGERGRTSDNGAELTILDRLGISTNMMSAEELMASFEISLDTRTVGLFYMVGLGVIALSTIIPVTYVLTLSPQQALIGDYKKKNVK